MQNFQKQYHLNQQENGMQRTVVYGWPLDRGWPLEWKIKKSVIAQHKGQVMLDPRYSKYFTFIRKLVLKKKSLLLPAMDPVGFYWNPKPLVTIHSAKDDAYTLYM